MKTNLFDPPWCVQAFLTAFAVIMLSDAALAEPCRIEKKAALTLRPAPGPLRVPARINGVEVSMGLDTGAGTLVTPEAASRLKLPRDYGRRTRSIGTTAVMTVGNVLIRDLEFAEDHFRDKSVASIPFEVRGQFGAWGRPAIDMSGLIGADVMSKFDFELDLARSRLTLYKVSGCKTVTPDWTGSYSQARFEITAFRKIAIPVEIDGVKLRAILDTGANPSGITRAAAARFGLTPSALKSKPTAVVTGVGNVNAVVPVLDFESITAAGSKSGPLKFTVLKVWSGESDVLLGLDFLRSKKLWISYATRTMFVQPEDRPVLPQGTLAQAQGSARPREIGYLGAPFRDLADETIQTLKLPPGARTMLARVIPTGPAAGAGLLAGDVLLSINGVPITGRTEWNLGYKSGETVKLTIFRNGQSMTVDVTLIDASAGATIGLVNGGADLIIPSEKRIAELFPAAQFPLEWAQAQYNIAFAYTGNPKGDKVENEEASIPYYEAALSIEVFKGRIAWNTAQINLGLAYQHRRQGGRQDNLERAIAAFTAVVTSRPKGSTDWARTQMLLGYAYLNRLAGDKNGNYLHAIAAFEAALAIKETTLHQSQLMQMQDRRGDLYRLIEPLNSRENIENAIAAYKEALQYKPLGNKAELQIWAKVAEKLGNCYRQRIGRPATENAALAVEAYDQALTVFTRQAYPDDNLRIYAQRNDAQAAAGIILPGPHL